MLWIAGSLAGLVIGLAGGGCGESSPTSPAGASDARRALDRALFAWRKGKPIDSLKNEVPTLVASDRQWTDGLELLKYEVDNNSNASGDSEKFHVTLWLKDRRSKEIKVKTQYDVSTKPLRVVRAGF
jgi:hypothetical protein